MKNTPVLHCVKENTMKDELLTKHQLMIPGNYVQAHIKL